MESPHQIGLGIAYTTLGGKLLLEADAKWINCLCCDGYGDFDWNYQWVFAFGVQYKPISKLALRMGYNYGQNPVEEHNGFVGNRLVTVQSHTLPRYYYETFTESSGSRPSWSISATQGSVMTSRRRSR